MCFTCGAIVAPGRIHLHDTAAYFTPTIEPPHGTHLPHREYDVTAITSPAYAVASTSASLAWASQQSDVPAFRGTPSTDPLDEVWSKFDVETGVKDIAAQARAWLDRMKDDGQL